MKEILLSLQSNTFSRPKQIKEIKFPLPSLDEQIRIANILSKAEALISQRKESLRLLDEFLKSTFLEMFGDPLNGKKLSQLTKHLRLQHGYAFKSTDFIDNGIPVIKIGTVNKGFFDIKTLSFLGEGFKQGYDIYRIHQGDLLISLTGTVGKDDYANTCFVPDNYDFYLLNQRVAKLIPDEKFLLKTYLDFLFKYPDFKKKLIKSNRGVRQANLGSNDIYSIAVNIPEISSQIQFDHIVEKIEALKASYRTSLQELENLYGSLSQRAFRRELVNTKETEIIRLSPLRDQERDYFLKRKVLATYIINQSLNDSKLGDTKFEKLLHLSDYFAIKRNLGQKSTFNNPPVLMIMLSQKHFFCK